MSAENLTDEQKLERHQLTLECMALAYAFQAFTNHCVFIDWSGHVDSLDIRIAESKVHYNRDLAETQFYTHGKWEELSKSDCPNKWLRNKRDVLKQALDNMEVPYEQMTTVTEQVYHHVF